MNSSVDQVIKNIGDIGLVGKYNSGSLTPMGINGPTTSPFLSIPEPGADYLAPVMKGGVRRKMGKARFSAKRGRRTKRRHRTHKRK
jgi:hypothetical protein